MCNPVAIVGAGLSIGSSILKHKSQNDASKANEAAANDAMRTNFRDIDARAVEENKAATNQIVAGLNQKNDAQGTALAAAAGAGVGGISVQALLNTIEGDAASYTDSVLENRDLKLDQLQREKLGATAQAKDRIASVPRASLLGTGLRIAGAGVGLLGAKTASSPVNSVQSRGNTTASGGR